ncbi:MAG TPA: histidine phosphatase family protein [Mesorhizobium sp.]|jgi:phosphohistidine phosphatase|nr:histidine phosphatase family protein [Mesorhizobium sp.]
MTTLFLLRHAKAVKASGGMKDFDRPLDPRGVEDIARIGGEMAKRFALPERVLCSASRRTRETLTGLGLPFREDQVEFSRKLYEAEADGYLRELQGEQAAALLLVGHNPATEELAGMLADEGGDAEARGRLAKGFPTSGLAVFDFDGSLGDLAPGRATLRAFLTPDRG